MELTVARCARCIALLALLASGALAACATADGSLRLVDAATGSPLGDVDIDVFIDDGIRCVTTPCPTESRTWVGRTDANGQLVLPSVNSDWGLSVTVRGYRSVPLERRSGTIRLARLPPNRGPGTPPVGSSSGNLQLVDAQVGHAILGLTLLNRGTEPLVFVRPRSDRFQRYEQWGGWRIGVTSGTQRFQPYPMPGPYIPANDQDLVTLEAGATHWEAIELGDWLIWPDAEGNRVQDRNGTVTVTVEWLGVPPHLTEERAVPPARAQVEITVMPAEL